MLKNRLERMPNKAKLWKFDSSEWIDKHVYTCQKCPFLTIYPTEYLIHYEWHALGPERFVNLGLIQIDSNGRYVTKQAYKHSEGFAIVRGHLEKSMAQNLVKGQISNFPRTCATSFDSIKAFKIDGREPLFLRGGDAIGYNEYFSKREHHIRAELKAAVEKFYKENPKRKWTEDWTQDDKDYAVKSLSRSSGRGTPDFLDSSNSDIG